MYLMQSNPYADGVPAVGPGKLLRRKGKHRGALLLGRIGSAMVNLGSGKLGVVFVCFIG